MRPGHLPGRTCCHHGKDVEVLGRRGGQKAIRTPIRNRSSTGEPDPNIRRGRSVVYNLHAHLVFITKYRRGAFTDEILVRCEEIMRDVCGSFGAQLREFHGETDHVHLLVHYSPQVTLSRLVNSLKGVSSHHLRSEFPDHIRQYLWGNHFWSPSYFAASCGGAPLEIIKQYIDQQKRPD